MKKVFDNGRKMCYNNLYNEKTEKEMRLGWNEIQERKGSETSVQGALSKIQNSEGIPDETIGNGR